MVNITELLIDYTKHLHKDDEDRTKELHVTDLTSRCPVGVVLEKGGVVKKEPTTSGKMMRFEVGHITEEFVKKAVKHAGLLEKTQKVKYEWPEYNMVGSPDVRMIDDVLLEVKSIHPNAIDKMDSNPERCKEPHEHYVQQLQLYLEKERKKRPECRGVLFYFALDGRTEEFTIEYDKNVVDMLKKRASVINECIEKGKRPKLPKYFTIGWDKRNCRPKWEVNWKVRYCMTDGIHQHCDPELYDKMGTPDMKSWIGKLEYQATKSNKNGTDPNLALPTSPKPDVKVVDGLTYEPVG